MRGLSRLQGRCSRSIRRGLRPFNGFERCGGGYFDLVGRFLGVGRRNECQLGNLFSGMSGGRVPPSRSPVCEQLGRCRVLLGIRHEQMLATTAREKHVSYVSPAQCPSR